MSDGSRRRTLVAALCLFALALGLRVAAVLQYEASHPEAEVPVIDEASYEQWALEIAAGDWLGDEVFFQEPLYPYWLGAVYALFGHERTVVRLVQALLGALAVLLVADTARRLFTPRAGLFAGIGMALYPALLLMPALLLKPNLFVPLLALFAWLLVRSRERGGGGGGGAWLALGALAGAGALLRGNALILLPLLALWPFLRTGLREGAWKRGFARALLFAAGVALVLGPVALRNRHVGGALVLTTSGAGTNLYGGNNAENPYGRATEFSWVRGIPRYEADDWRREAERRIGRPLRPDEVSSYWIGETLRSVRAHPAMHARILWNKLRLTLGRHELPDNHHIDWDARYVPVLRLPLAGFALWGSLALGGALLVLAGRRAGLGGESDPGVRDPRGALELAGLALLYLGTIVLTVTSMRARTGLLPLLLPFAGYGVDALLSAVWPGSERRVRTSVLALALLVGALLPVWPVLANDELAQDLEKRDFNYAARLVERGESLDVARRIAAEILRAHGTMRVRTLIAEIDYLEAQRAATRERQEELLSHAMNELRIAATSQGVRPTERYRANRLAGRIQAFLHQYEVAVRRFRDALAFAADDPTLKLELADALLGAAQRTGDAAERESALAECEVLLAEVLAADPELARELAVQDTLGDVRAARAAATGTSPGATSPTRPESGR